MCAQIANIEKITLLSPGGGGDLAVVKQHYTAMVCNYENRIKRFIKKKEKKKHSGV